jgi:nudix-type nucleoside diphosphatase (YffH/AdpP family)
VPSHRITKTEVLSAGFRKLLKLQVELPDGGSMAREVLELSPAVALLPFDGERRRAILVRQFRAPVFQAAGVPALLEAPAGMLDEDDPEACARREAMEEIGLEVGALERVAVAWTCPGVTTEQMHLYLAPYVSGDRVGEGGGLAEEHEDIEVVELPLTELPRLVATGGIADAKTILLVQALQLRRPELFQ